jgi:hypothetical protein
MVRFIHHHELYEIPKQLVWEQTRNIGPIYKILWHGEKHENHGYNNLKNINKEKVNIRKINKYNR